MTPAGTAAFAVIGAVGGESPMTIIDPNRTGAPTSEEPDLDPVVVGALREWPSVGVAVAVIGEGTPARFRSRGVADITSARPVTEDTVFRVGSLTKPMTAVAVMQLCEQGLVDLDAPAADYLRTFKLVVAPGLRPPTVRHLLTHTAGIGFWRRRSDLILHFGSGTGVTARSLVPLAEYYRDGLPVDVEPGTRWAYSNHGFATIGQIVEDVSGEPLDHYLRRRVFAPLGMEHTDLVLSGPLRAALATGYVLRRAGPTAVAHREIPTPGGGGAYSTAADVGRFVAAMLHGGANDHGSVLAADTVASMLAPHFRPDPRSAGMGLAFEPREESGRVLVGKGGTVAGFLSAIEMALPERVGVVVLTNTGGLDNRGVAEPLAAALTRRLVGLPGSPVRDDIAARPEVWRELCGWYAPDAGPVTNLWQRAMMGAGAEVAVRRGRLVLTPLTPVPGMRTPMVLHPDDPDDPRIFRIVFPQYGRTDRVVFTDDRPPRLLIDVMSWEKRPDWRDPRRWAIGLGGAGIWAARRRRRAA